MASNRFARGLGLLALVVLTLGLAGCGSDEPAAVTPPAPPPAPPPFQPQPVEVALGELGGTVTLMTTEAGGFTLNGEAFEGGEVTAENGNTYALSLADGQWTAAYQAATATLTLGITGEEVTVMRAEDGTYWIGDEAFEPGGNFAASNGNHYMLALADDGSWTASYVPATTAVTLGITGEEVSVMRAEDGSYHIGDTAFSSGGSVTATNGNEYTLTMADGTWTAAYVPLVQQVAVGNSGLSVPFTRHENGTWTAVHPTLGEQPVTSGVQVPLGIEMYYVELLGDGMWRISYVPKQVPVTLGISGQTVTVVKAENGTWSLNGAPFTSGEGVAAGFGTYTLTIGSGDTWTATFQEVPTVVTLGTSGDMVTVVMVEDGTYTLGGDPFASGGEVTADNGNVYSLTLAEGAWSAMFVPMDVEIGGTGLTAMTREDQDGWDVDGARVPKSGTGDITVDGASFHVWHIDGDLFGARFDKAINGDSAADNDAEAGRGLAGDLTQDTRMILSDNDEDTVANELRTSLTVGGSTFSIADLLGAGSASASGNNFVASARGEIEKIRGDVAALLGLSDTSTIGLSGLLTARWTAINGEITKVFGASGITLRTTAPDEDDILGEIDEILAALSSATQFAAATAEDGGGVFESAALDESEALDAFDANETEANIIFGTTGETRYGALSQKSRDNALDGLSYSQSDDNSLVGAFSYGTVNDTVRVWHIQTSGNAYYEGGTTAVSGDGNLYNGKIEIEVRFGSKRVSGLVSELQTPEGDAWVYQFGNVESIILPPATSITNNAEWTITGDAQVTYERRAGSPSPLRVSGSTFAGHLLGTNDEAGDWTQGVWSVGSQSSTGSNSYLAGSFGATRVADQAPVRPGTDDGSVVEASVTSGGGTFKLEDGSLKVTMNLLERVLGTGTLNDGSNTATGTGLGAESDAADINALSGYSDAVRVGNAFDALFIVDVDTTSGADGVQRNTRDLSVDLSKLVANAGSEVNTNGPQRQREIFVAAVETIRADLAALQGLDTPLLSSEQAAWTRLQALMLRIFHQVPPKLARAYLDTNGQATDLRDDALGLIDSVLNAFASSSNLKVALDRDGTGIFNNVTTEDNASEPSYSVIWGRQEVQMKAWADATDYTRFGAWRVRQDRYAGRNAWTNSQEDDGQGNDPGVFAYSQLPSTKWVHTAPVGRDGVALLDPSFPVGGTARYFGKTVAIQNATFHEGEVELLAQWNTAWTDADSDSLMDLGTLTMTISNFVSNNGDPVKLETGGVSIEQLTFSNVLIESDSDNQVVFNDTDATVTAYSPPLATGQATVNAASGNAHTIQGIFVGQDIEGPLGVIGTYKIDGRPQASLDLPWSIVGSFGAERP